MTTTGAAAPRAGARLRGDAAWIAVVAAGVAAGTHIWKLPAALDRVRADLDMGLVEAGLLVGLVQVASMVAGLAVAWCGDALGLRRLVGVGLLLLSAGSLAGAATGDTTGLMAARALEGVGFLLCTVLGPPLIRRSCPEARLNRAMAGWGAFQGTATLVGMAATALALQLLPWRSWWVAMAVLVLAPLPALWRWVPADGPAPGGSRARAAAEAGRGIAATVRSWRPWLAGTVFAAYTAQWMAVLGFLPTVLRDAGATGPWPGLLAGLVGGTNALGALAAGRLLDGGAAVRSLMVVPFASMAVLSVLAFGVPWGTDPAGAAGRVMAVLAFSLVGGLVPAVVTRLTVDVVPPGGTMAGAMGLMQQLFNVGNFAGPPLLAWLATLAGGWHAAWWMCCGFSAVGIVLACLLTAERGRPSAAPLP